MLAFAMALWATAPAGPPAGAPGGAPAPGGMDFTTLMLYISAGAILLWLVVLRPAQRQERERKALLSQLKINDEVLTSSGIIGNVVKIKEKAGGAAGDEDVITLRVDDKTRIQVVRSSIARVHRASDDKADEKKEPDPKTNS